MIFEKFDVESIIDCVKFTIVPAKNIVACPRKSHGFAYFIDGEATYTFPHKKISIFRFRLKAPPARHPPRQRLQTGAFSEYYDESVKRYFDAHDTRIATC